MTIERFGSLDGQDVLQVSLQGPDGMEAKVLTWGAVVRDLIVPVAGGSQRVVLGLNSIEDYVAHSPYFGAIVGRYGNRIGRARFNLNGTTYQLDANEGENQLHGGAKGFGSRLWSVLDHTPSSVTLSLVSEDGDMGYPGRLVATCTYTLLPSSRLRIELDATSDKPTPVNLTTHGYFNLDGSPDISSHELTIAGDYITPTRPDLIPTGEITAVAGTDYDFTAARPIHGPAHTLYDINYVLRGPYGKLRHAATLASRANGLSMELWTTEPGVQFYDGHLIDMPVQGLAGARYRRHGGLCLEPQRFPDSPNNAHFPSSILPPGQVSRQVSELRFSR
ncbi:aldose epimerase family protein [Microvirga lotononidis]|uniref:Aldose 1-epimerase n=1 Tax=Microvirga lotononidis TaxID=864069 RepID=I4YT11_9HYPH|nr:aldose epimerase family protein [Microvirga lotononidis]EIM27103.1 galactose mutarotase-like enzyme [Microvirga lotononidis]WQO28708.1 aldose epimerase family protein [Microvirga lotononidis]